MERGKDGEGLEVVLGERVKRHQGYLQRSYVVKLNGDRQCTASEAFLQVVESKFLNSDKWAHEALIKEYWNDSTGPTGLFKSLNSLDAASTIPKTTHNDPFLWSLLAFVELAPHSIEHVLLNRKLSNEVPLQIVCSLSQQHQAMQRSSKVNATQLL